MTAESKPFIPASKVALKPNRLFPNVLGDRIDVLINDLPYSIPCDYWDKAKSCFIAPSDVKEFKDWMSYLEHATVIRPQELLARL
jgi:hypothetical protein